ncbi:hypothetical protein HW115_16505 [Verrucomicrobiaceae bacterium N1E253]|uniref:Uncharacterized protein n=1 Tax=Oceaniferula marina TaxID=2748318 RepID=A0A851GIQ4_9BACT|nr:hypothetical protein [Oceaniferula marina]NWK57226.1 hypothetical protein [Oceaniferula marina]
MKRRLFSPLRLLSTTFMLTATSLNADTYYKVEIQDLTLDKAQKLPEQALALGIWDTKRQQAVSVRIPESSGQAFTAFIQEGEQQQHRWHTPEQKELQIAIQLKEPKKTKGIINLWMSNDQRQKKLQSYAFQFDPSTAKPCSKEQFEALRSQHYQRLANGHLPGTAWFRHQAGAPQKENANTRRNASDLDDTFAIFSGGRAISENLALDRDLILATSKDKPDVEIKTIKGVTVKAIDWTDKLPSDPVSVDPLSHYIPIDQHALFVPSINDLFKLIDHIERDGAPVIQSFTVRNPFRTLPSRYRRQMGLDVPDMAAKLLPIQSVAVTGGDPFFPMGSDVAVLFESDKPELLFQSLSKTIELKAKQHQAKSLKAVDVSGSSKHLAFENTDRSFSCHLLLKGTLVAVANSSEQIKRLTAVTRDRSLGASEEFRFFRHRYPIAADESAFVYLSDATIRRWCSPELRIGASRRTRAAAALGELNARALAEQPIGKDFDGLLGSCKLAGSSIHSEHYGNLGFITPVSELKLTSASATEAQAYEQWRRGYESGWAQVFDPIAIQLKLKPDSQALDITVLPLSVDSDYNEMIDLVGEASLSPKARSVPAESLLYFALALDKNSELFDEFDKDLVEMLPGLKINPLSWVGNSVSLHLEDGFFWKAVQNTKMSEKLIGQLPLAIRVESTSKMKLALFLTAIKGMIGSSAPDLVRYETRKHGGKSYVAVLTDEEELNGVQISLYYAALPSAFLLSLDENILHRAIDREAETIAEGPALDALPQAKHCLFESNPRFLTGLSKIIDDTDLEETRRMESWRAIPILNEWHRRFPGQQPALIHQQRFASDLYCPGGKGYQWNAEAMTMESVAYGHPGAPRNDAPPLSWLTRFNSLQSSLGFEDGGVRIRAKLYNKQAPEKNKAPKQNKGEVLSTAKELINLTEGNTWLYKNTIHNGDEISIKSSVTSSTNGTATVTHDQTLPDGSKHKSTSKHHIDQNGFHLLEYANPALSLKLTEPDLELPPTLHKGDVISSNASGKQHYEGKIFPFIQSSSIKIIGRESITTPAGTFKDCIKIEKSSNQLYLGNVQTIHATKWYYPGLDCIKTISRVNGQVSTTELVKIITPEK